MAGFGLGWNMAKIYETNQDVDRDQARNQLRDAQERKHHGFDDALAGIVVATAAGTAEELHQLQSRTARATPSRFLSGLHSGLKWAGGIMGVLSIISWFRARGDEAEARGKIDALGPEDVKYPPLNMGEFNASLQEGKHCSQLKEVATAPSRQL